MYIDRETVCIEIECAQTQKERDSERVCRETESVFVCREK